MGFSHICFVLATLTCIVVATKPTQRAFDAEKYHFLHTFGGMLAGTHLPHPNDRFGGTKCAGCTILLTIVESLASVHKTSIETELNKFCSRLPPAIQEPCDVFVDVFGPVIVNLFERGETVDAVCLGVGICGGGSPGPVCRLLNPPADLKKEAASLRWARGMVASQKLHERERRRMSPAKKAKKAVLESPWKWLVNRLEYTFNMHVPFDDKDNDTFSPSVAEFRGYSWRGRDCNDFDASIRPGTKEANTNLDPTRDWNCNGIYGTDPSTGQSLESELCGSTPQYGIAALGDSAGAHFHIPRQYMNASQIEDNTFQNLVEILSNEFDWPQMSEVTGYVNSTWVGAPSPYPLGSYSLYRHYVQRNRCMHRDYQNICVNGARAGAMASNIIQSFRRNQTRDLPMLVEFALIGNDVCNGHHTFDTFTKPADFKNSILASLDYLDTILPNGSHVSTYGLATGSILYDTMHALVHPLGWALYPEITYSRVYDYLNCLEVSPCWGWMNSNATVRNYTDYYAAMLSDIYPQIVQQYGGPGGRWKNFDLHYWDLDFQAIITQWNKSGGQTKDLIEPIDGFHPSQTALTLLSDYHIQLLTEQAPQLLPPINPNNAKILQLFGNQGGY